MKWAKLSALFVIVTMSAAMTNIMINDNFYHGVGNDNFNAGFVDPWQTFIHLDLMTGLVLFCTWLVYREKGTRIIEIVTWVWMILWWGNIGVGAYILVTAVQSAGRGPAFFMGPRSGEDLRSAWGQPGLIVRAICLILALATAVWLYNALRLVNFEGTPAFGLYAGFLPMVATFILLAFPGQRSIFETGAPVGQKG